MKLHDPQQSPSDPIVRVDNIVKRFGAVTVLDGLSFSVMSGEVYSLIGRSGSGKSTSLRCLNALEPIQSGEIYIGGTRVDFKNEKSKRGLRKRVGMVFQAFNLFPHMTALENITLGPIKAKAIGKQEARERALQILSEIGLAEKAKSYPDDLSGGQRQRVAIARALAMEPELLLLDEITSSLDPELTREVLDLVAKLADQGITMVMVSHEIGFVRKISSRIGFVENGRLIAEGTPEDLFSSENPRLQSFLSQIN